MQKNPTIKAYDKYARAYDEEVVDFWKNFPALFIDKFVDSLPGKRILNLGSGSGRDSMLLQERGLEVICVDASQTMVDITASLGFESHQALFSEVSFPAESFDGVWAYTSLIHIPKSEAKDVIRNIQRLLKPEGSFVIGAIRGNTAGMVERKSMPGVTRYFKNYTPKELTALVEPVGFTFLYKQDYQPHTSVYLNHLYKKR